MSKIITDLQVELQNLVGLSTPTPVTVHVTEPNTADLAIDFTAVDSMSCSFHQLHLSVPKLRNSDIDELRKWGEALCQRVTYLLENIGPLEVDPDAGEMLIRSTPPDQQAAGAKFYEIILKTHSAGNFSLRRYESERGVPGRRAVDLHTTHEVLLKLVGDLIDTIP